LPAQQDLRHADGGGTFMLNTVRAIFREGKIQLLEEIELPEGTEMLVTPLLDEADFWAKASQPTIEKVWDNTEDNIYAELIAS
jgi:Protein of unknown function DUF104